MREEGRAEEGKAAVNTLLLRTGQGYPEMAQERGEREGERAGNCAENHSGHETDIAVCGNRARQKDPLTVARNTNLYVSMMFTLCVKKFLTIIDGIHFIKNLKGIISQENVTIFEFSTIP